MTAVDCIWLAADLNWIPACSPTSLHGAQPSKSNRTGRTADVQTAATECVASGSELPSVLDSGFIYDFSSDSAGSGQNSGMFL